MDGTRKLGLEHEPAPLVEEMAVCGGVGRGRDREGSGLLKGRRASAPAGRDAGLPDPCCNSSRIRSKANPQMRGRLKHSRHAEVFSLISES